MKIFIKKLKSQESGYSGDTPNQRGEYILIPRKGYEIFPNLSELIFNDFKSCRFRFVDDENKVILLGLNYVWNNKKFFPDLKHSRNHDERRLYRNKVIDSKLKLDRGVIVLASKAQNNQDDLCIVSIQKNHPEYNKWEKLSNDILIQNNPELQNQFQDLSPLEKLERTSNYNVEKSEVVNLIETIDQSNGFIKKQRKQKGVIEGDPAESIKDLFKNQNDFTKFIRKMYDGKCALRKVSLITNEHIGLEAAHILADKFNGPLVPTNGILLSSDLHKAFDKGAFCLDENNRVLVNEKVPKDSNLWKFNELKIEASLSKYKIYEPYYGYIEKHKEFMFNTYS